VKINAQLQPITAEDLQPLIEAAKKDNHVVLYPTHVIKNNDEIIGYTSVCATPVVMVWADSQKVSAAQSVILLKNLEKELQQSGIKEYLMPCAKDSPYFPHMTKLGFTVLGENVWHFKNLTN
jgi:hypothetical protein